MNPNHPFATAANEDPVAPDHDQEAATAIYTAANEAELVDPAQRDERGYIRISPLGEFPYPNFNQVVDATAANAIIRSFKGGLAKARRFFGIGKHNPPIYFGHPDEGAYAEKYQDTTPYGEVDDLEARDDGIYAKFHWTPEGDQLIAAANEAGKKLFFSPRWGGKYTDRTQKKMRPTQLLSLGLTEMPNLPAASAANEQPNSSMNPIQLQKLRAVYKLPDTATLDEVIAKAESSGVQLETAANEKATTEGKVTELQGQVTAANEKATAATTRATTAEGKVTDLEAKVTAANEAQAATEGKLVDFAVKNGCIPEADRPKWKEKFKTGFVTAANELLALKPGSALRTEPETKDLGARRSADAVTAANEFYGEVDKRVAAKPGLTRASATAQVRKDPKFTPLWELMDQKSGANAKGKTA
jgi:hypothetical protein